MMTKRHCLPVAALRDLDPDPSTHLTEDEQIRAEAMREQIMATPAPAPSLTATRFPRRSRAWLFVPACMLAAAAVAVPIGLSGGSAFASWSATAQPLTTADSAAAAATCRARMDMSEQVEAGQRVVLGERRGGWNSVLMEGPHGNAKCLIPDDLLGTTDPDARGSGFFGSAEANPAPPPAPPTNGLSLVEYTGGKVTVPGRLGVGTKTEWFSWITGVAGPGVVSITVHPGIGPEVEASLEDGRYSAWWPAGSANGDTSAGEAYTYTLTLKDGRTREIDPNSLSPATSMTKSPVDTVQSPSR